MKNIICCLFALVVSSCGHTTIRNVADIDISQSKTIEVDEKEKTLDVFGRVRYVKLETSPESLMGTVDQIMIDENADRMFLLDLHSTGSLYAYDLTGRFKNKIGIKGRGPGEYFEIRDFDIDPDNQQVRVMDLTGRKFIDYSYDGKFVRSRKMDCLGSEFKSQGRYFFYCTDASVNENKDLNGSQFVIFDTLSNTFYPYSVSQIGGNLSYSVPNTVYKDRDTVYFSPRFSNTVYKMEGSDVKQAYKLNMENGIPSELMKNSDDEEFRELTSRYQYLETFVVSPAYAYFRLLTPKGFYHVFHFLATGKTAGGDFHLLNGNNPLTFLMSQPIAGSGNELIEAKSALSVLSVKNFLYTMAEKSNNEEGKQQLDGLYENLQESDNPVILFYELQ